MVWGANSAARADERRARLASKFVAGRDHHPHCFSIWMAGGGVKPGFTLGGTDELGYHVAEDRVHVHDLQATILHCLGLDHTAKLTYLYQGPQFQADTDVVWECMVTKLLA